MAVKVFIDGQAGTTGLRIHERLADRNDLTMITLTEETRKDPEARRAAILESDVTFLCLPDDAAREAVALAGDADVRIIDASTAHRTNPDWAYGFPELSPEHREKIRTSKRVAVPGCYASGFASLVYPMVHSGLLPKDYPVQCFAMSGYSGGGKKMIAEIESPDRAPELYSPRFYGLANNHKHLPEMQKISGLEKNPCSPRSWTITITAWWYACRSRRRSPAFRWNRNGYRRCWNATMRAPTSSMYSR